MCGHNIISICCSFCHMRTAHVITVIPDRSMLLQIEWRLVYVHQRLIDIFSCFYVTLFCSIVNDVFSSETSHLNTASYPGRALFFCCICGDSVAASYQSCVRSHTSGFHLPTQSLTHRQNRLFRGRIKQQESSDFSPRPHHLEKLECKKFLKTSCPFCP